VNVPAECATFLASIVAAARLDPRMSHLLSWQGTDRAAHFLFLFSHLAARGLTLASRDFSRGARMPEPELPLEDTPDASAGEISATPVTPPPAMRGRKRLTTLAGSLLVLVAIPVYLYWSVVHDQNTTARIQQELSADGVQVVFSQSEPREVSFSPFQSITPTVKIVAPSGNITNELMPKIREINLDMDLLLNNCPITDDGLARSRANATCAGSSCERRRSPTRESSTSREPIWSCSTSRRRVSATPAWPISVNSIFRI
jgi:hypothetical protein